jgi:hypothetical protein
MEKNNFKYWGCVMRTTLLVYVLSLMVIYRGYGNNEDLRKWNDVKTLKEVRYLRYIEKPIRSYRNDTDSQIVGETFLIFKLIEKKKDKIQLILKMKREKKIRKEKINLFFNIFENETSYG